jgi:hypothetical protein
MDVSKDEIRKLAEEFPYSPVIQYLLTRRLKISSDAGYGDSVARTAIYFNNPHWLSQLLRRQTTEERVQELEETLGLTEVAATHAEPVEASLHEDVAEEVDTDRSVEVLPMEESTTDSGVSPELEGTEEPSSTALESFSPSPAVEPAETELGLAAEPANDEGAGYLQTREEELPRELTEDTVTSGEEGRTEPEEADNDDDASVPTEETADRTHIDMHAAVVPEPVTGQVLSLDDGEADNDDDNSSVPTDASEDLRRTEEHAMTVAETDTEQSPSMEGQEAQVPEQPWEAPSMESTEAAELPAETGEAWESEASQATTRETMHLPDGTQTVVEVLGETEEVIPIQPMHTMDYFASQGVSLEEEPSMRMDTKAKAFTGWLRAMKPVHPVADANVPVAADNSGTHRSGPDEEEDKVEILTEAMAEVYAKQGLRLKAIDVYRKLSLLHPDKSSIFAAKIDQLKGISS